MITSKLTTRGRTTIPQVVRAALQLREGDEIIYVIEDGRVILREAHVEAVCDPFAAFGEWHSEADRTAYRDL